jgi:hypothetical protein
MAEPTDPEFDNNLKFRIYKRDCEVRVKEFGQDVPYTVTNPFGGPHHDEPSGAEI